jgi:hypothetical protein
MIRTRLELSTDTAKSLKSAAKEDGKTFQEFLAQLILIGYQQKYIVDAK